MRELTMRSSKIAVIFLVATMFLVPFVTRAADETSIKNDLQLYGGHIHNMVVDNVDSENITVYVSANISLGLFYSYDLGESWEQAADDSDIGTVGDIVVADDVSGTAFITAATSLMRTEDSGKTWVKLSESDFGNASLAYRNGIFMAATNDSQVYVSTDQGDTLLAKTFDEDPTGYVHKVTADSDAGVFYVLVREDGEDDTVAIYRTEDSGDSWTQVGDVGAWSRIAADPATPGRVIVLGTDGLIMTEDGGDNWEDIGDGNITSEAVTINQITFYNDRIYVGHYFSDDDGASWFDVATSVNADDGLGCNGMAIDDVNDIIWASCSNGPCRSEDGGENFTLMKEGFTAVTVTRVSLDASEEVIWLATHNGMAKSENFHSSVLKGKTPTWEYPIYTGKSVMAPNIVLVSQDDADTVIAFDHSKIWKTQDGGATWEDHKVPVFAPGNGAVDDLVVDEDGNVYVAYNTLTDQDAEDGEYGGVYMSDDFGETWTDLSLNVAAKTIVLNGEGNPIVGSSSGDDFTLGGIWVYDGTTWTEVEGLDDMELDSKTITDSLYLSDVDEYIVITSGGAHGGIFVSSDFETWNDISYSDQVSGGFMGLSIADDPGVTGGFYVGSGFPGRRGEIYKCTTSECFLFHSGYVEQYFYHMVFDGLVVGSTNGAFAFQSLIDVTLKKKKKGAKKYQLIAQGKDALTSTKLNGRYVKFYRKVGKKKKGAYKFFKKKKIKKGKATLLVTKKKKINWYQARLKPTEDIDIDTYGNTAIRSTKIKVPKKKK